MRHQEELLRLLREANPVPDARDRYEDSDQARALSLLVEERRQAMPTPSDPDTKLTAPPKKPLASRSVLAFIGAAAATVIALALVAVFTFGDGEENVGGGAGTGTISISVQDWSGVEGYRLLAVVWSKDDDDRGTFWELAGGAFWTMIDSDPFSGEDVVHPPLWGDDRRDVESWVESWGAGDYAWERTASLEPGTYRIDFSANPGELKPYGSYVPAEPIERHCSVDVEVRAGKNSTVVISGIPRDGPCSVVESSESAGEEQDVVPPGAVAVAVQGVVGRSDWDLAGVLYKGIGISDPDNRAIGGFAADIDKDPFSYTLYVHEPDASDDAFDGPFPYVAEAALAVEPGTYTLVLWLGSRLGPYSRWVPGDIFGLVGCETILEVKEGPGTTVIVTGGFGNVDAGTPECWTEG